MLFASHAPLEHLFNNHYYCGSWCQRKKDLEKMKRGEMVQERDDFKVFLQVQGEKQTVVLTDAQGV